MSQAQVINDQSVFIKAAVDAIKRHLIEGSFFAAIIIFIFLANIRTTLIAAIAIPTSIISTFALMAAMGFTLNQITMLALTLMVGIVIDDAIIVLENIYRYIEEKGMPPLQAAIRGHQGNRPGRDGHHAVAAGRVPADRIHGRHRRTLHVLVRIHRGLRHRGLAAGVLHADADAELALHQAARAGGSRASRLQGLLHLPASSIATTRACCSGRMAHRKTMWSRFSVLRDPVSIVPLFMVVGKSFLPEDDQSQFNVLIRTPEGTSLAATTNLRNASRAISADCPVSTAHPDRRPAAAQIARSIPPPST